MAGMGALCLDLRSTPQEEIHDVYHKPGQKPLYGETISHESGD